MGLCFNFVHVIAMFLIASTGLTTYIYVDTRTNTSFKIASEHVISIYNAGCEKANGTKWYIQVQDMSTVEIIFQLADNIYGYLPTGNVVVTSDTIDKLTLNQIYQYSLKFPASDDVGLYYKNCAVVPIDINAQMSVVWALTLIVMMLMFICYIVSYYYIYRHCRQPYVEIA